MMATQKISLPLAARLIRRMHQTRLSAFEVAINKEHETKVVERVLAYLSHKMDAPRAQSHSFPAMGLCVDCDAEAALLMWRELCDRLAKEPI